MAMKPVQQMRTPSTGAASRIYSRENVGRYSERARQRRRGKRIRRGFICLLVLLLLGGGSAVALTVAKNVINSSLSHGDYLKGLTSVLTDANAAKEPFNVLLLGTDGRPGEDTYRSDSIILAHVDPIQKTAALISIPRDTKVEYKGSTMKINESHSYGGPEAVLTCVEDLCGVDVNFYAEVSFDGMEALVDAVGGIDLYIPEGDAVDDPKAGNVKVEAGQQHLDGEAALTFCRSRYIFSDGDYTRMRHQRMVLGALAHKILNDFNVTQIPSLLESLSEMLITTMDVDDIIGVIGAMSGMDTDNIWSANLPSWSGEDTYIDGKSYVFVKEDELVEMMARVEAGEDPKGPNTQGSSDGTGATLGDLSSNSSDDWANGTATTESASAADEATEETVAE